MLACLPALHAKTVGSPCTSSVCDKDDSLSLLIFARRNMPPLFIAADSSIGPSCLQGPHQSAYTSTNTGTGDSNTNFWKFSEVTSNTQSSFFAGVGPFSFTPAAAAALKKKSSESAIENNATIGEETKPNKPKRAPAALKKKASIED